MCASSPRPCRYWLALERVRSAQGPQQLVWCRPRMLCRCFRVTAADRWWRWWTRLGRARSLVERRWSQSLVRSCEDLGRLAAICWRGSCLSTGECCRRCRAPRVSQGVFGEALCRTLWRSPRRWYRLGAWQPSRRRGGPLSRAGWWHMTCCLRSRVGLGSEVCCWWGARWCVVWLATRVSCWLLRAAISVCSCQGRVGLLSCVLAWRWRISKRRGRCPCAETCWRWLLAGTRARALRASRWRRARRQCRLICLDPGIGACSRPRMRGWWTSRVWRLCGRAALVLARCPPVWKLMRSVRWVRRRSLLRRSWWCCSLVVDSRCFAWTTFCCWRRRIAS